eukprot:TRINITY_DN30231_c0_g1_i1.p1 TRINITY_DN30231_c0_g1~~TRINITY_DN30231_c0_g1_i1.p1  ORF type:complete len:1241 (+),score=134.50 TRINITY_DN30231_c0_g1_i1:137-3859(+)
MMVSVDALQKAKAVASAAPLQSNWCSRNADDGCPYYINATTGECRYRRPAEGILDELVQLVQVGSIAAQIRDFSDDVQRLKAARTHLLEIHNRACVDMNDWSGPYVSPVNGLDYYYNQKSGASVWHHPAEEWQEEIRLRWELLRLLLRFPPGGGYSCELLPITATAITPPKVVRNDCEGRPAIEQKERKCRAKRVGDPAQDRARHRHTKKGHTAKYFKHSRWCNPFLCLYPHSEGRAAAVPSVRKLAPFAVLVALNVLLITFNWDKLQGVSGDGMGVRAVRGSLALDPGTRALVTHADIPLVRAVSRVLMSPAPKKAVSARLNDAVVPRGSLPSSNVANRSRSGQASLHRNVASDEKTQISSLPKPVGPSLTHQEAAVRPDPKPILSANSRSCSGPRCGRDGARASVQKSPQLAAAPSVLRNGSIQRRSSRLPRIGRAKSLQVPPSVSRLPPGPPRLFPIVQRVDVDGGCCAKLSSNVRVVVDGRFVSPLLKRAATRVEASLRRLQHEERNVEFISPDQETNRNWTVNVVQVRLSAGSVVNEELTEESRWSYVLHCGFVSSARNFSTAMFNRSVGNVSDVGETSHMDATRQGCTLEASSVFGAIAALQSTVLQLFLHGGISRFQRLRVEDWPAYPVRGIMIDTGRRFVPKEVVLHQVIDGMALMRMNLLHLHLSDFCRFSVDLPNFPELNRSLSDDLGLMEGQYSVGDVHAITVYARERGIMVLPEIDLPGHASGLLPLEPRGLSFCKPSAETVRPEEAVKIFDDPEGHSRQILRQLLSETAAAFSPGLRFFHVGGDEANPSQLCNKANIVSIEEFLVKEVVQSHLGLTAVAWEELRLKKPEADGLRAAGGTEQAIIMPWRLGTASSIIRRGHRALVANLENHYLDFSYKDNPISSFWYDIAAPRKPVVDVSESDGNNGREPECVEPQWEFRPGRFLGGLLGRGRGNGGPATLPVAQGRCQRLGNLCAGITCRRGVHTGDGDKSCEPRRGEPFLAESENEDSWVRRCPSERAKFKSSLLGGVSAMWTDNYCHVYQCGAANAELGRKAGTLPTAAIMFRRQYDSSFALSFAGMVWPRAAMTAGALWNYEDGLSPEEVADHAAWTALLLRSHGVASCPPGCECDELSACGRPYPLGGQLHLREDCFQKGSRSELHGILRGKEQVRPLEDALRLCFWMAERCGGVGCTTRGSGGAGENFNECRLYQPSPLIGRDIDDAGEQQSVFLIKNVNRADCVPYRSEGS